MSTLLITGGAGFIGSAVVRNLLAHTEHRVVNVDKLTYAGNLASLRDVQELPRYSFDQADICDAQSMKYIFNTHRPDAVMHLAAESHVDRSIDGPAAFIETNVSGTCTLLQVAAEYAAGRPDFRFHHISTDEVYGDLDESASAFVEENRYAPNNPYAATKAASDHLVRAWHRTYGLDVVLSNCSNNYGPFQFPEKLIPLVVLSALDGRPLPVYGDGGQVRDWLFVDDHARALQLVLERGTSDETYNIGGHNEKRNLDVVQQICRILDEIVPDSPHRPYEELITFVADRPGHDRRYAMDASKIKQELGWQPQETFDSGLRKAVQWYLENRWWWEPLRDRYDGQRLGGNR